MMNPVRFRGQECERDGTGACDSSTYAAATVKVWVNEWSSGAAHDDCGG